MKSRQMMSRSRDRAYFVRTARRMTAANVINYCYRGGIRL